MSRFRPKMSQNWPEMSWNRLILGRKWLEIYRFSENEPKLTFIRPKTAYSSRNGLKSAHLSRKRHENFRFLENEPKLAYFRPKSVYLKPKLAQKSKNPQIWAENSSNEPKSAQMSRFRLGRFLECICILDFVILVSSVKKLKNQSQKQLWTLF